MAILSALVASCSPINDPSALGLTNPSLAGAEAGAAVAGAAASADLTASDDVPQGETADDGYAMSDDPEALSEVALPEKVAYLPLSKPASPFQEPGSAPAPAEEAAATAAPPAEATPTAATQGGTTVSTPQAAQAAASDAQAQGAAAAGASPEDGQQQAGKVPVPADYPVYATAADPNQAFAPAPKKKSFFASLFSSNQASASPLVANEPKPKPVINLESAGSADKPAAEVKAEVKTASLDPAAMNDALPGVRQTALFEIKRKSGLDDDSDVDVHEEEDWGPINVATAGGLARLAPNGLIRQTDRVDVACLKPSLVRVLKTVESHYGRKLVVTSGYRSPAHNRRARGAKNSLHMYCAAADIQVPGVSKWELANYFRSMPGRGGIGTYCHTESVHIDVGPERDWNWRCRRRK